MPPFILVLQTKCPQRPTKIIAVHCEISHCVMNVPVFGKTVTFANLPSIAVAVSAVVPFYKSCVNHITNCRGFYRSFHLSFVAKNCSQIDFNYPAFPACFMNSGVSQAFYRNTPRTLRAARFTGMCNFGLLAVSLQNSFLYGLYSSDVIRFIIRPSALFLKSVTSISTFFAVRLPATTLITRRCSGS